MSSPRTAAEPRKGKDVTDAERTAVIEELLEGSNNSEMLWRGDFGRVAGMFGSNPRMVTKLWKEYGHQKADGVVRPNLRNKRLGKSERKGIDVHALREKG